MKKPTIVVRPYRHSTKHKFILDLRAFGKGRKFFKTRADAEAEALRQRTLLEQHSREAVGMSQREMSEIIHARKTLAEFGETIADAVRFRVDHLERVLRCKTTVTELVQEVLDVKRKDGAAPRYLESLKLYLSKFSKAFGERPIAAITPEALDNWLRALPYSPKSRANFRAHIGVLFGYAMRRRMIDSNPITHTARPKLPDNPPEIFTVDELRALLESATPDVIPMLAIGAFAGLREAEIERLDWSEIDLARGHIEVLARKAKSARRRIIPIQPNLAAWLAPLQRKSGPVVPAGARKKLLAARKAAELVKWPRNGLRHSFASYRLAAIHDAPRVSTKLGHTSPQMLYSTYREVVRPEEAERYWKIAPAAKTANVVAFASM
jgi:Site-specific recombinase XerD